VSKKEKENGVKGDVQEGESRTRRRAIVGEGKEGGVAMGGRTRTCVPGGQKDKRDDKRKELQLRKRNVGER